MSLSSLDTTLLNQITIRIAAGLASALALLAVLLHQDLLPSVKSLRKERSVTVTQPRNLPSSEEEQTETTVSSVSLQPRIAFCAQHVTPERSFVVFENGTCVIVNEPSEDPISEAKETLKKTSSPEARFITRQIENGHLMVTYREPVFHCLFAPEIEDLTPLITGNFAQYLSSGEKNSMPADWTPPADAKLGLYSRKLLNLDAAQMSVAKVVRSRPLAQDENTHNADSSGTTWKSSRPAPLHVIAEGSKFAP